MTFRLASGDAPWLAPPRLAADFDPADATEDGYFPVADDDPRGTVRMHHPGSDVDLQLIEVRLPPGAASVPHAHRTGEIIYVLEGELRFGNRVVGPGASVHIGGQTLYDFTIGPEGVRFLNFRATKEVGFLTKEEFLAARSGNAPVDER